MSNFKIALGKWIDYWADASLDLPSDARQRYVWTAATAGSIPTAAVVVSTNDKVPSGYALEIDASVGATDQYNFSHAAGTSPFVVKCNNAQGYTIEALLKVISAGTNGQHITWNDDVYGETLFLLTSRIELENGNGTYPIDTTDDYHTYRITVKDTEVKVYVDDVLRITNTLATAAGTTHAPKLYFGDDDIADGGKVRWAYIRYNTDAALSPDEDWRFKTIDIQDKRGIKAHNIIRSHNSIIAEGKMKPTRIRLSGSVAGNDYDSFRNTVRRFKKLLHAGTQRIYIDDERFIEGLHGGVTLRPRTQDYAALSLDFQCRYPFWRENWASYFSTTPVANATFYVVNEGDIEVPLKIIMTGAAAATITNDVRLKNATAEQDAKYIGTLFATQELWIDKGFDNYNDYAVKAGSNAHAAYNSSFGSYEGDLFTLQPGENAFVQIGTALGTIEFYWREAFLL